MCTISTLVQVCRRCCGGHGYLAASGLPSLFGDYAPATTYEGDNTVLFLQTARYVVIAFESVGRPFFLDIC